MNKASFYAHLRKRLNQGQVDGMEAILDESMVAGADLGQCAYILATADGETGGKMQPVRENLNYSASSIRKHFKAHRRQGFTPEQLARNPKKLGNVVYGGEWGRKNLGNTQQGDGYAFRGWGIGQWTGRRNTKKAADQLGLDLLSNPALLDDVRINARLLVVWMLSGTATGAKLGDYVRGVKRDYLGARKVWGGVDAAKYVKLAKHYEAALIAAGYAPKDIPADPKPTIPDAAQEAADAPQGGVWAWVGVLFAKLLGGRK